MAAGAGAAAQAGGPVGAAPIVMKFGGTSVESAEAIRRVAGIVRERLDRRPVVVLSAMAQVTDQLLEAARAAAAGDEAGALDRLALIEARHVQVAEELLGEGARPVAAALGEHCARLATLLRALAALRELTPRSQDAVAAFGELLSTLVAAAAFRRFGVEAERLDARELIVTDGEFTRAAPRIEPTTRNLRARVLPLLDEGRVPVLQGFIGATVDGVTTTLGRGGSDFSASIVGLGIGAREIQIWTDVDGMLTTDPRIYSQARRIKIISFAEAAELAYFGARVLHPSTIQPAVQAGIPVRVLNSRRPEGEGTLIVAAPPPARNPIKAIACKRGITTVNVTSTRMLMAHGFLRAIFEVFDRHRTAVDMVSTSEVSVSTTLDDDARLEAIVGELEQIGEVSVERDRAIISVVGERIRSTPGIAALVFQALREVNVEMISQGASEINIGFVVSGADVARAVARLHEAAFREPDPEVFE